MSETKTAKLTPVPQVKGLERTRKLVQAEQAEVLASEGLVRIEPITGLDIVPNKVRSKSPDPITIRPEECYVDREYQRSLSRSSMRLIHKIVTDWDWTKFKAPIVTKDEQGRYLIIDGQHTAIAAATHPDIDKIPALFVPLTDVADQAKSFIGHNTARIPVSSLDLYHARITAGEELVVQANKILNENGITVVRSLQGRNHQWLANQTMATSTILKILDKHGLPKFVPVVEFIQQCAFSPISADHWRFVEGLLAIPSTDQPYTPSMMLEVIKATHQQDAINEASKIAASMEVPKWQGLLVFYKNRYRQTFKVR